MKLFITVGASGSGKTSWAKEQTAERVNRDDIRRSLNIWHGVDEDSVTQIENTAIESHLSRDKDTIVDATNLRPKFIKHKVALARKHMAEVVFVTFDPELKTLLERNESRDISEKVPVDVIKRQYNTMRSNMNKGAYILQNYPNVEEFRRFEMNVDNPMAIVVDIDGTVAHHEGNRSPYDYSKVSGDAPNYSVIRLVRQLARTHQIIFMSGRKSECYDATVQWLNTHVGVAYSGLHMRADGDNRRDYLVKHELFVEHVESDYNIDFVLDDRATVVQMWRTCGLTCLQVAEGNF